MAKKSGLGRGLDAIMIDNSTDELSSSGVVKLKLSEIEPNKNQPRKNFEETALAELAHSIELHGVLQPLVVRPLIDGTYQLVAGERRWRASRMAGLTEVPVVIKELTDAQVAEIALVENLQREDLDPIEEALGYKELAEKDDKEEWVKLSSSVAVNVTCEQTGDGHAAPLREAEDIANLAKKYNKGMVYHILDFYAD